MHDRALLGEIECDVVFVTSPDRYLSSLPLFPDGGIYAKVQLDLSLSFMVLPPSSDDLLYLCFFRTYRSVMVGIDMPSREVCCRATRGVCTLMLINRTG
jgi:hypothetical protein